MAWNDITWSCPPADWPLADGEVHVWAFPIQGTDGALYKFQEVLAQSELERAGRFRFERDRSRFVTGRAQLRHILSSYLQVEPGEIAFSYGSKGKPLLQSTGALSGLMFNLAHSQDLAVLAITRTQAVGVDIEKIRSMPNADDLVSRFFSSAEAATFRHLPDSVRAAAFFNLWTRKEAWLKATGEGIGGGLDQVEVSFLPGEPARFLTLGQANARAADWGLYEITPAAGFTGAVAVPATQAKIECWRWTKTPSSETAIGN
jgi:4'-phosphopantetheinyl transferase